MKTPTTSGARSKVPSQSLVSNPRQRLAPIPVPEKSAAISQTIQHFANLQRQNNLRRSNQQMTNNSTQQTPSLPTVAPPPPPTKSFVSKDSIEAQNSSPSVQTNSDYDYIGGMKPTLLTNVSNTSCTTPPPALPVSKPKQVSPSVGNPLYCSVPPPLHYRQQQQQEENWEALNTDTTSALDREYARLFGDRMPPQIKNTKQAGDESASESSSSSSSSENASEGSNSLPPPRGSPPPLPQNQTSSSDGATHKTSPPVVRNVQLKSGGSGDSNDVMPNRLSSQVNNNNSTCLPDDNNNNIDESTSLSLVSMSSNNSFASGKLTSPKMVRRNKTASKLHSGLQSPTFSVNSQNQQQNCKFLLP